jgi:hypothetical protein
MEEFPDHRKRKAPLFLLVCALHGVLGWFLLATSRITTLNKQPHSFELLMIPSTQVPLPTSRTVKPQSTAPEKVFRSGHRRIVDQQEVAEPSVESNAITPPVDWNAELAKTARAASGLDNKPPTRNFGFPQRQPTTADYPQFDWDYARTHRVESLPEGGVVIHLNDNCVLVLSPFPFPFCSPFKQKVNGDLFKHMHDPGRPRDAGVP